MLVWFWSHSRMLQNPFIMMVFVTPTYNFNRLLGLCANCKEQLIKILGSTFAGLRNDNVTDALPMAISELSGAFQVFRFQKHPDPRDLQVLTHTFFVRSLLCFSFRKCKHANKRHLGKCTNSNPLQQGGLKRQPSNDERGIWTLVWCRSPHQQFVWGNCFIIYFYNFS